MPTKIRLLPENIAQYARHGVMEVNFSDLDIMSSGEWHESFLNTMPINVINTPDYFWKRGEIHGNILANPRIYIASMILKPQSIPKDVQRVNICRTLRGFRLETKNIPAELCFWKITPVYK